MLAARGMGGQHWLAGKIEERREVRKPKRPQRERTVNQSDSKVLVFGTRGSADAFAIRDFLYRCDVPFQWIEVSPDQPDALPSIRRRVRCKTIAALRLSRRYPARVPDGSADQREAGIVPQSLAIRVRFGDMWSGARGS